MAENVVSAEKPYFPGLEGVIVAISGLTSIDGKLGKLMYRGYNIHELAQSSTYEEVVYLLFNGELPTAAQLDELKKTLAANRELPSQVYDLLRSMPKDVNPMAALRTAVSALSFYDDETEDNSHESVVRKAYRLTAKMATIVAAFDRIRNGKEPVAPKAELSHAANFLYMLNGEEPNDVFARAFDIALILHADHEMNASTFAARVTASTLSDYYSAITSAVGTLKGALHGGANTNVMKMLLEIGDEAKVEDYIRTGLANKQRFMGFGHRVYKTMDPRAIELKKVSHDLGARAGNLKWYNMSEKIHSMVTAEKGLDPNVDFYSASAYYMMGIALDLYTPIFAVSRIAGWSANVIEQYEKNRLMRPDSDYVGPSERSYVPMNAR
jgi:2-methylcitrate synthase/citrate synthase II